MHINANYLEALILGVGLFAALGPKDALVIRQSLGGSPNWWIVWVCILADCVLIGLGIAGMGSIFNRNRSLLSLVLLSAALYLLWFGNQRFSACLLDESMPSQQEAAILSRKNSLKIALVLGFANPYAWLDTIVIIGSIGGAKPASEHIAFATGAMTASMAWFVFLALVTARVSHWFKSRWAWRLLDFSVGLLMFYLAFQIIIGLPFADWAKKINAQGANISSLYQSTPINCTEC